MVGKKIIRGKNYVDRKKVYLGLIIILFFAFLLTGIFILIKSEGNVFVSTGKSIDDVITNIKGLFGITSLSDTYVTRHLSNSNYESLENLTVRLQVEIDSSDGIINYGIEESFPQEFIISYVVEGDYSYNFSSNKIYWIINSSNSVSYLQSVNLTYVLLVPNNITGDKTFSGSAIFTSEEPVSRQESVNILGENTISGPSTPNQDTDGSSGGSSGSSSSGGGSSGGSSSTTTNFTNKTANNVTGVRNNTFEIQNESNEILINTALENPFPNEKKGINYLFWIMVLLFFFIALIVMIKLRTKSRRLLIDYAKEMGGAEKKFNMDNTNNIDKINGDEKSI